MHTDNCTQHMNTYLKKGVGRDSSGCPMVMESQSYSGTDYILKSTSDRAIEDAISLDAEKENMCSLATGLQYSFCIQSAVLAYHIFITKNVLVCLLSSPLWTYHSVLFNIFWHKAFSPHFSGLPPSLAFSILFCPSGLWDIRHGWEAYGLLIKKQGRMRPQLTRADICTALLEWIYRQRTWSSVPNTGPEPAQLFCRKSRRRNFWFIFLFFLYSAWL